MIMKDELILFCLIKHMQDTFTLTQNTGKITDKCREEINKVKLN